MTWRVMRAGFLCGVALLGTGIADAAGADRPGHAPQLARAPLGMDLWQAGPPGAALQQVVEAGPGQRQEARWHYSRSLIASGQAAEALGVLEVMLADGPDLALAGSFQLARGRVLVELGRGEDALAALQRPSLANVHEACAWRLRALALAGAARLAVRQMPCARSAIAARAPAERAAFLVPGAQAALAAGEPGLALDWLRYVSSRHPAADLIRGRAYLLQQDSAAAAMHFARAARTGTAPEQAEARLGLIETALLRRELPPRRALAELQMLGFRWRGGELEKRAMLRAFSLARQVGDDGSALAAAATLVRYHELGLGLAPLLDQSRSMLFALMAPDSKVPLDRAAGLYWEHRDLAPAGVDGDRLALGMADRLQGAGLYARAAELLEHQLTTRARDVAQGPLSVRVAKLHILAGRPQRAIDALRMSSATIYPPAMLHGRQRVEAVALQLLGRGREALAVLQAVPGSGALQAELLWHQRSWAAFADLVGRNLPAPGTMSDVRQAMVLRQAISLGMLGREAQLAQLRARYAKAFAALPTARAFELLTRPAGAIDPEAVTQAMAALPAVSPAGELADLLDAAPVPGRKLSAGS